MQIAFYTSIDSATVGYYESCQRTLHAHFKSGREWC